MDFTELITYYSEDVAFELSDDHLISRWIVDTINDEEFIPGEMSIIFCSDEYLLNINQQYLQHDYFTDIITFEYSREPISGDLFISIDRIRDNAEEYEVPFEKELYRVIIHGVLHLMGYQDKSPAESDLIRSKENEYLNRLIS